LVAKKRSALKHVQDQFRERETGKTYLALVQGSWPEKLKVIDNALHKFLLPDGERRVRVTSNEDPDGMRSISLVKVAERLAGCTLLEVTIKTGRTHQIRVHLSAAGYPLVGDVLYGGKPLGAMVRQALHAHQLSFDHPVTGALMGWEAPLPVDFLGALEAAQLYYNGDLVAWPFQG